MKKIQKLLSLLLALTMILTMVPATAFAIVDGENVENSSLSDKALNDLIQSAQNNTDNKWVSGTATEIADPGVDLKNNSTTPEFSLSYDDDELVRTIIVFEDESLLELGYSKKEIANSSAEIDRIVYALERNQNSMAESIENTIRTYEVERGNAATFTLNVRYHYTIALNGISAEIPYGALSRIRSLNGVKTAYVAPQYTLPEDDMVAASSNVATPTMNSSTDYIGTTQVWHDLGYTGTGMTIAVVDTGLDIDHPSFSVDPEGATMDKADIADVLSELNATKLFTNSSALPLSVDDVYYSVKVPFGFNYVDENTEITHDYDEQGDHGTHVAGTATASRLDTTDVVGVAPDAQLIVMKVFGQNGGAFGDDIAAALEDCILLDVDVVNMSLGSPAGFTEDDVEMDRIFKTVQQSDMMLAIAAGNSGSAALMNNLGTNLNLTSDPDIGMLTNPSVYASATTVASFENSNLMMPYFTVGGTKVAYNDVSAKNPFANLAGEHQYVMVPGYGEASDYASIDVRGKIAVVQRGGGDAVTFIVKQRNAFEAGAVALIVYNHSEGDLISMYDDGVIANVFISKADGALLAERADKNGEGTLVIMSAAEQSPIPNPVAGLISDFSAWGVTPDLQLAPDVAAPGGNIYSAIDKGLYGTMSGTSMACPHIAGMSALVLQYLHDKYPNKFSDADLHVIVESLIMSTATPLYDEEGVLYSPRLQGAGAANVYDAISSPVYLTSEQESTGELTPKASIGDDDARTGVYEFSFNMHNFSTSDQTYLLDSKVLTDQFVELFDDETGKSLGEFMGQSGRELGASVEFIINGCGVSADINGDGMTTEADAQYILDAANGLVRSTAAMDINGDGVVNTADAQALHTDIANVTVAAGETVTVDVKITLSAEDVRYITQHYPNGIYVEGFIRAYAQSEGGVDLSFPYLAFYGDWSASDVIDSGWYYESDPYYNRYLNVVYTDLGESYSGLGLNPYIDEDYDPEMNVLSPNDDTYYDSIDEMYISLLRNAEMLDFTWSRTSNGEELFYQYAPYVRKTFYWAAYQENIPAMYASEGCDPFTARDENGDLLVEDLEKLTFTIRAFLDDGDLDSLEYDRYGKPVPDPAWADDVITMPIVIDLEAPRMDLSSVEFSVENGRTYVTFDVSDNYNIAAVMPLTVGGAVLEYIAVNEKEKGVDGETATIKIDITNYDSVFQIALGDYGANERYYELVNPLTEGANADRFYAYNRLSSPEYNGALYITKDMNGWYSFETSDNLGMHTSSLKSEERDVYAAEYIDGYILGAQAGANANSANELFVMKAGSWERTVLNQLSKTVYQWPGSDKTFFSLNLVALDMAFDYSTNTLYMLANAFEGTGLPDGAENLLVKIDYLTGDFTVLGIIEASKGEDFLALTLACDNDGTLYTVNYENGHLYKIDTKNAQSAYGDDVTEIENPMNRYLATDIDADGKTDYWPAAYTQSMTVDHKTNKLYWAAYQGSTGIGYFFEVDKTTGALLSSTLTSNNSELVGLFKPYDTLKTDDLIPDNVAPDSIRLLESDLYLAVGQSATIQVYPEPYYAELGEVTYFNYNDEVASVNRHGMVEALAQGSSMVEIMVAGEERDYYTNCFINVTDVSGTLFAYSGSNWLLMDAGKPTQASTITDGPDLEGTVTAATYYNGAIYAATQVEDSFGYATNLYKLDPNTLAGTLIGTYEGTTTALAFNYADGNMYTLLKTEYYGDSSGDSGEYNEEEEDGGRGDRWPSIPDMGEPELSSYTLSYELAIINPLTAQVNVLDNLDAFFPYNDSDSNACSGALAIDRAGNFYVNGYMVEAGCEEYIDWETGETYEEYYEYTYSSLVRFNLTEDSSIDVDNAVVANEWLYGAAKDECSEAMVWSEKSGGIIRAYFNEVDDYVYEPTMSFVDVSYIEEDYITEINLGPVRGSSNSGVQALALIVDREPGLPTDIPVESVELEDFYTVAQGESIKIDPSIYPWNADAKLNFFVEDPSVASVDKNGVLTGLKANAETILYVTNDVYTITYDTAVIYVEENPGNLYGFFQADLAQKVPLSSWARIPLGDPSQSTYLSNEYDFTIYAAEYYDGYVYAFGQSETDGLYYSLKINPSSFYYQILAQESLMVRDMAFDYTTGTMYVTAYDEYVRGGIYQMDLRTGELTFIMDLDVSVVALAADVSGLLYAAVNDDEDTVDVYVLNPALGVDGLLDYFVTDIPESPYLQSMTYDHNNDALYMASHGKLYELRVSEGEYGTVCDTILLGSADTDSGEMVTVGCVVSGLFSIPMFAIDEPIDVAPTGISLPEKSTVAVGKAVDLNAKVLPISVHNVDQTIEWISDDESIATVIDGVVYGVSEGEVFITAIDSMGNEAYCVVYVTAETRKFYAYDEISRSWMSFDSETGHELQSWSDAPGLSPIVAATYVAETDELYAYDADGYFYLIDTETFERTKLGNGIHGWTTDLEANDAKNGVHIVEDVAYEVVDMTHAVTQRGRGPASVVLYGVMIAYNISDWLDDFSYVVFEIDPTTGEITPLVTDQLVNNDELRPTNLIYRNEYLYTVNGFISGMITRIDPTWEEVTGQNIFADYWGDFNGSRSMIVDPITGVTYALRDMRTEYDDESSSEAVLVRVGLGTAYAKTVFNFGAGLRLTGLFIK